MRTQTARPVSQSNRAKNQNNQRRSPFASRPFPSHQGNDTPTPTWPKTETCICQRILENGNLGEPVYPDYGNTEHTECQEGIQAKLSPEKQEKASESKQSTDPTFTDNVLDEQPTQLAQAAITGAVGGREPGPDGNLQQFISANCGNCSGYDQ